MSREPIHDVHELASLYVAGALSPDEIAAFEARVSGGDRAALDALAALEPIRARMDAEVRPVAPPVEIKARLMERVASRPASAIPAPSPALEVNADYFTLRAEQTPWEETGVPGVRYRTLFVDVRANRKTLLFQLDPGARYPDHHHEGVEECYVVSGDLHIAGTVLYAGDYHRAQGDTDHGDSFTRSGCTLLITCPAA